MKLYQRLFLIFLICFLTIGLFNNLTLAERNYISNYNEKENEIVATTNHAELYIEKNYISKEEIYNIADKIEKGIRDLKKYLGSKYLKYNFKKMGKIKYYIQKGDKISHAIRSNKSIELYHVHLKQSPYIHETAHVLLDNNEFETPDTWLTEGLPIYLNSKFAEYPPELVGDKNNPNKLSQRYVKSDKYKVVLEYFPKKFHRSSDERWAFYSFAGSFIKFIENKYGKEKLLKLYNAKRKEIFTISDLEDTQNEDNRKITNSTEDIFGVSIEELKNEWLDILQN